MIYYYIIVNSKQKTKKMAKKTLAQRTAEAEEFWQRELQPFLESQGARIPEEIDSEDRCDVYPKSQSKIKGYREDLYSARFYHGCKGGRAKKGAFYRQFPLVTYRNFSFNQGFADDLRNQGGIYVVLSDDTVQLRAKIDPSQNEEHIFEKIYEKRMDKDHQVIFRHRIDGKDSRPHRYYGPLDHYEQLPERISGRGYSPGKIVRWNCLVEEIGEEVPLIEWGKPWIREMFERYAQKSETQNS